MKISVGVSNRHMHLTEETFKKICNENLEVRNKLNQPNQFASTMTFTIKTPKSEINNVRLLGPFRSYNQVEISRTDAIKLGLNPPVRTSGDIKGSSSITIIGPNGSIDLNECVIIADRHIHISKKMLKEKGLENYKKVQVKVDGEKGGILDNVDLKISDEAYFELHLDTDDANAFNLKNNDEVEIIL